MYLYLQANLDTIVSMSKMLEKAKESNGKLEETWVAQREALKKKDGDISFLKGQIMRGKRTSLAL
jgi:hypothetical protein